MEDDEGAGEDCGMAGMGSGVEGKTEEGGNWQFREGGSRPPRVRGLPRALWGSWPWKLQVLQGEWDPSPFW